jgi:periplasmic protein CpxP/Spy
MTKNKFFSFIIIGLVVSNVLLIVFVVSRKPPHPHMDGPKKMIIKSLHFDKKQVDQYSILVKIHVESSRKTKNKIHNTKGELYTTLLSENDSKKDSLLSSISKFEREIEILNYNHFLDIKKICKGDQLNDFEELTKKMSSFFVPKTFRQR